jgi:hypothetical protein
MNAATAPKLESLPDDPVVLKSISKRTVNPSPQCLKPIRIAT